jgi:hypothetical protein
MIGRLINIEQLVESKYCEKKCTSANFLTVFQTRPELGSKPDPLAEKLATNCLSGLTAVIMQRLIKLFSGMKAMLIRNAAPSF